MTYDTKCYELAEYFLQDGPFKGHEPAAANLAEAIQQAIEDWFIIENPSWRQTSVAGTCIIECTYPNCKCPRYGRCGNAARTDPRGPFFSTQWEREDYERRQRGEQELGPGGAALSPSHRELPMDLGDDGRAQHRERVSR
jgi:hypothetical protein